MRVCRFLIPIQVVENEVEDEKYWKVQLVGWR